MPRFTFGVCLVCLFCFGARAFPQYQFDSWTTENGLPQNSVNDILQTRDGYLWLATFGGLVRFDGVRFVVFDRATDGIRSQRITTLHEDSSGTLWAGTEDGMLIRYRGRAFATYTPADGLPHARAFRIEEDEGGHLWIKWRGVVTRFDGERFINYTAGDFDRGVRPHARVFLPRRVEFESESEVWWNEDSAGVHALVKGTVETVSFDHDFPPGASVTGVTTDRRGNLWIHTRDAGAMRVTRDGRTRYTMHDGLPTNDSTGFLFQARNEDLWFVDGHRGDLFRILGGRHEAITRFAGNVVSAMYEDREGSIWIGTLVGLHRLRDVNVTLHTERAGLSLNWVYSILQARDGAIWVGTWGGGVNKFHHGRFTPYRYADGLPSDHITSIQEDKSGRLWVGTTSGIRYLHNGRFEPIEDKDRLLQGSVWAIHHDRAGNIWFATDHGLVKMTDGGFIRYSSHDGLSHNQAKVLFEDRGGALWIGTYQGLTRLEDGTFTTYTERDGLVGTDVRAIHEGQDGVLWIGTYDSGLYRLKDNRLTRFTRRDGLHDNGVFQILEDDSGHFWMGSNRGIYRVSRRELNEFAEGRVRSITSLALGIKDGLSTLECNGGRQPAGLKTADGRLWFPTMGGIAVVDPKSIGINTHQPPVVIEEFRRGGDDVDFRERVEIPSHTSHFEIRYTAPSFVKPEHVRFRYKLVGLDDAWVEAGDRRVTSFYGIPPGDYRFVVIAANNDGIWNTTGASVGIVVLPAIWRTWWFIALACIALASLIFVSYERRVWRVRREHAVQKAFSKQLIDSQERERHRISNEMHDSLGQDLNVIKMRARLSKERLNGSEPVWEELDAIDRLAEKACGDMKEIAYDLRPYQLDKLGLKLTIEGMVSRVGRTCDIEFTTDIAGIDDLFDPGARIHIYRIVQESVSNIVKHSHARRAIVTIVRDAGSVRIRIEDDGRGFKTEPGEGVHPMGKSFGLMGIRERARMLGGDVTIQSSQGTGTSVLVTINLEDREHER